MSCRTLHVRCRAALGVFEWKWINAMNDVQRPCPRCAFPLQLSPPLPARLQCPKCGAEIKLKAVAAEAQPVAASHRAAVASGPPMIPAAPQPVHAVAPGLPPPSALPVEPRTDPMPANSSSHGKLILGGIGVAAFLALGIFLVVWLFSGSGKNNTEEEPTPSDRDVVFKPLPAPPPDPRIKIVQPTVEKGVAFLKASVPGLPTAQTRHPGHVAAHAGLIGLALLEGGVPADDPAMFELAAMIRKQAPTMSPIYDLSASLFFLNRWNESRPLDEADRKMSRTFALRIIANQGTNGIWAYTGRIMSPQEEEKLVMALTQSSYKPTFPPGGQSMSNTQFAMLAVWGARKHGVPVREPLLALAAYFHANQNADGSWIYPANSLKATSTCAGLIALAIEKVLLEDKEFATRREEPSVTKKKADVDKAFKFLAKIIGRKKGDPVTHSAYGGGLFNADAIGDLYFLWTLERVGVIYAQELIDGKNWFDWGYPIVMKAQNANGSWAEAHSYPLGPLIDTPLAILFLTRANIAKDLTDKLRMLQSLSGAQSFLLPASPGREHGRAQT
jgi:hypothetical protein